MIFYKYKSDSDYTEKIFTSRKVYLPNAKELNDPFECSLLEIGNNWITKQILEKKKYFILGFISEAKKSLNDGSSFFGAKKEEIIDLIEIVKNSNSIENSYGYCSSFQQKLTGYPPSNIDRLFSEIDNQLSDVGIFSLTTNPINQLMWSHYSKEHTGICLGFEKEKNSRLSNPDHLIRVKYSDSIIKMDKEGFKTSMTFSSGKMGQIHVSSYKIAFNDDTFQRAMSTKPKCWQYEKEWRYVEPFPGEFEWPGKLCEVIFGLKCNDERKSFYIDLIEKNVEYPISLYEIQKKRGTNQLIKVPFQKRTTDPKISKRKEKQKLNLIEFSNKMERLLREEKYGEVLSIVNFELQKDPNSFFLISIKGRALGFSKEHEKALECFDFLIKHLKDDDNPWYQKGCALFSLNRIEEGVEAFKEAYRLNNNDPSTCLNIGLGMIQLNSKTSEALKYLERADRLGHKKAYKWIQKLKQEK